MPIYEFYCVDCHMIFSFLSRGVNTSKRPRCPRCRKRRLQRQVSSFAVTGKAEEGDEMGDLPLDEGKLESAMTALAGEAENINEEDPRQAARLMRKFSQMSGMEFGEGMEEALGRMEDGEDPEKVEAEMGDMMDSDDLFVMPGKKPGRAGQGPVKRGQPRRDSTLYEM
jgi:putative FmdB family regulatory protein